MSEIQRMPFLRLLMPLLIGILVQYYIGIERWSILIISLGIASMLLSFFISKIKQYKYRYVFGLGLFFSLFSIGVSLTWIRQYQNLFPFTDANHTYTGYVVSLPQQKPNTIALALELVEYDRKIVCYLPKDTLSTRLFSGDYITFLGQIKPFDKAGKIGHFDYANYMLNKGYCGYSLVNEEFWEKVENDRKESIQIWASRIKYKILLAFKDLNLDNDSSALLSALILGYTADLTDDLVQSFRDSGVAHILAVSGFHVGIIYLVIISLLSFLPNGKYKQFIIILLIWIYIFVVGLPPSAVRAGIMLSIYCLSIVFNRRTFSYNLIFAAAFFILIWNPLLFFDLGFQLSFSAVLAIKIFMPRLVKIFKIRNRIVRYFWNIACISFAAQLGIFPLSLYYFESFPLYFLFANLLIVPIVSIVIYLMIGIAIFYAINSVYNCFFAEIISYCILAIQYLLHFMIGIATFFSQIIYSSIKNIEISLFEVFFIWLLIFGLFFFMIKRNIKIIYFLLIISFISLSVNLYNNLQTRNTFTIYNNSDKKKIVWQHNLTRKTLDAITENTLIKLNGLNLLILVDNSYSNYIGVKDKKMEVDYLYIETDETLSLLELSSLFNIRKVIFGNNVSTKNIKRMMLECEKIRIPYYDIYLNGNLTINF